MTLFQAEWGTRQLYSFNMRACLLLVFATSLQADELTQKMTARVSEEAEALLKLAPDIVGTETLHQSAVKPPSRFHPRTDTAPAVQWVEHTIVSEYGFARFATESGAIHELRRVTIADGRQVVESKKAQGELARALTATDDNSKKELLKQFEKYGLSGAVSDFGQLLLLFTRRSIERYEFTYKGAKMIGYDKALVFAYKQIDGAESLTVFDEKKQYKTQRIRHEGEIRVRADDFAHSTDHTFGAHRRRSPVRYAKKPRSPTN